MVPQRRKIRAAFLFFAATTIDPKSEAIMAATAFRNLPFANSRSIKAGFLDEYRVSSFSCRYLSSTKDSPQTEEVSLYRSEGMFAVNKPLDWTSSDVVSYVRGILERDARVRGANPAKIGRRNKRRQIKVGHGGTLDPLATGVLVIGVGKATKELQAYLSGPKRYRAGGELGFETTTLDMEGNTTKTAPYDHITVSKLEEALGSFRGKIQQIPPIFSAIKKGGKKLYQQAREGVSAEDIEIEPREVEVFQFDLLTHDLPKFDVDVECGGGTYIRSLIRDVGYKLDCVATMTSLVRTQQGQFGLEHCLDRDEWNADNIYGAIDHNNEIRTLN